MWSPRCIPMRNFLLAAVAAAIALPAQPLANDSFQILTSPTIHSRFRGAEAKPVTLKDRLDLVR